MRILHNSDFLALWEAGRLLHPLDQGILAVQAAFPEHDGRVADWPIGRRNRALAELRCAVFGAALRGWIACRQCSEQLEFEIDGRSLAGGTAAERVLVQGHAFRLPTSRDLAAVVHEPDETVAARRLLQQCAEDELPESAWNEKQIEIVGESMAATDPLAEIRLSFDCPSCGAHFEESLDLPSFIWEEVEARGKQLLMQVHTLASTYGWSQAEILSLSPGRRDFYMEMVRA
jgi:hypothetical protein